MKNQLERPVTFIGVFTLLHGVVSTGTYLWSIKRSMEVAYRNMPQTWLDSFLQVMSNILLSPIFALIFWYRMDLLRGVGAYVVVLANSLLWAVAVWWLVSLLRKRRAGPAV